ncbi:MAG: hypothetical protein GX060_03245 [Firmicutes bacterium]|nr:hypothetical protein [Bacillota bacterium]
MHNYNTRSQYSSGQPGYPQPNQFGAYSQSQTQDIGTTRSEQIMQRQMGGMSQVMQADRNVGSGGGPTQYSQMSGGMGSGPSQYGSSQYQGGNQNFGQGYNTGNYGGGSNYYGSPNQYGAYGYGQTQDIGTTRSEQMMQGGMGGISQAMQADRNVGSGGGPTQYTQMGGSMGGSPSQYGSSQYQGGSQNFGQSYNTGNYGGGSNYYGSPNQYGAYGYGQTQDIGTTRSEQMMQGGMGGISQAMQADRNVGSGGGPSHSYGGGQTQYTQMGGGMGGGPSQYGTSQYQYGAQNFSQAYSTGNYGGGSSYYASPNQYGAYGYGQTQDIGTTRSEQMMQGGMGGISQAMQADRNVGSGPSHPYGGGQPPYAQMSGGMGGGSSQHGTSQYQGGGQNPGNYGRSNYGNTAGSNQVRNPGDTPIESQAKQNLGVSYSTPPSSDG